MSISLQAENVCAAYGKGAARVEVLKGFSLTLRAGEFVALMGPSGSGKSTFLHLAAGLLLPESGTIAVGGQDVTAMGDAAATPVRRRDGGEGFPALTPLHTLTVRENAAQLDQELADLQTRTRDALAPDQGNFFLVFHPAYGYYAREFGVEQRAIENEGKTPSPRELEALVRDSREQKVAALIVQPEFNRASAQVVADALGAKLVVHSPLQKDYFENIDELTAAILQSFGVERPAALPAYSRR